MGTRGHATFRVKWIRPFSSVVVVGSKGYMRDISAVVWDVAADMSATAASFRCKKYLCN